MLPIRTILHPTDFSECSDAALSLARLLAREQGARLLIVHVAPVLSPVAAPGRLSVAPKVLRAALEERRLRGDALARSPVEVILREGDAIEEIVRLAAEREASLVVMGSHGRSGFARWLLGSVAEGVMRKAHCPVLTVKTPIAAAYKAALRDRSTQAEAARGQSQSPPKAAQPAEVSRVVVAVCEGNCRGLPITRVHHRAFPEIWAEGDSMDEAIAQVIGKLISARETCSSRWHRDLLAQAITDVRTYKPPQAARTRWILEKARTHRTEPSPPPISALM